MNYSISRRQLIEPVLLLNKKVYLNNIKAMADRASRHNLIFRPDFKTHQSHVIGQWFRDIGVKKITVAPLNMAEYFVTDG